MAAMVKKQSIDWNAYEAKAIVGGNLMLFISPELAKSWYPGYDDDTPRHSAGQTIYADRCIEDVMSLKYLFGISYRHLEGLIRGLLSFGGLAHLPAPDRSKITGGVLYLKFSQKLS